METIGLDKITQGEHIKFFKSVPRASVTYSYLNYVAFTVCHLLLTHLILLTTR